MRPNVIVLVVGSYSARAKVLHPLAELLCTIQHDSLSFRDMVITLIVLLVVVRSILSFSSHFDETKN